MNFISEKALKFLRKIYLAIYPEKSNFGRNWNMFSNKEYSNDLIYKKLIDDKPCMIARFGSTELELMTNYLGVKHTEKYKNTKNFIRGDSPAWWWEPIRVKQIKTHSGFFPNDIARINKFCELMIKDIPQVDILGSWLKEENVFNEELKYTKRVVLEDLEPFFAPNPWTRALEGKKVLVVHPYAETIEKQYEKRNLLFEANLLPTFELTTLKAVQSLGGENTEFKDWFEALDYMKGQIEEIDFDICIIGAGAYGFPLAAYVKRLGKKSIHLAGSTQLLFGIKGKRWEEFIVWPYMNLFNEHWVRPNDNEKPSNAQKVEGACYW
ncbi:hypothetical protein SAMN05443549_103135 [Flavobacterium fluvii]|uniref:Uncharacterized protein n=1 Tax=Flavobacterium fluvii TaxID=468056 RepID=A0A1M5ILJ8_9FLAO|nr:hypothetical protein [Flavobacterium fluvii]SHG28800.1 hypothetical protein SAMN05443549_103135 [Flavobacterium fluvii]